MNTTNYLNAEPLILALDCIIFGFDEGELKLLLIKRHMAPSKGGWSLMGGFIQKEESLEQSAKRVLHELTEITEVYMEQLHLFGDLDRDPVERVLSVAYYALTNIADHNQELSVKFDAKWFALSELPPLVFDHKKMVDLAIERLRQKAAMLPIGLELLPEKFTMPQLQRLYEAIYGMSLDKRNFSKKILSQKMLVKLDEKQKGVSKKGAYYYKFDRERYNGPLLSKFIQHNAASSVAPHQ